jgi:hypothetical protein
MPPHERNHAIEPLYRVRAVCRAENDQGWCVCVCVCMRRNYGSRHVSSEKTKRRTCGGTGKG